MKERDALLCNLKFTLLFLVVLGHWIEPYLSCAPWVAGVYRIIYTVHMPLFAFLSGTARAGASGSPTPFWRKMGSCAW